MASPLHLIDGAGVITTPLKVARYLAEVLGADPSTLPGADAPAAAGSGVPSISVLHERGMNYRVVAVFGGQSTGKSTLLNELFGTSFATMNSEEGRSQTTKGCFLSKAILNHDTALTATGDLFVMDFEGTDGVERGENQNFEKQLSLFALSVADTLIVNMFAHEVGRFNAANLSLLQAVFEVNLQLLSHEPRGAGGGEVEKPTLLFVLRDHTRGPVEKLQDGIVKSLEGIWSKISKPALFADSDIGDFFNMSFCALPHYDLQRPLFDEAAHVLRRRFSDVFCPTYLYKGFGQDNYRHIALDDVADYLANCWHSIQTVEDLDIPTQREFVAITRCRNVSDALASEHDGEISERLGRLRDNVFTSNISSWTQDAISRRKAVFASQTGHYSTTVTQKVTAELQHRLEQAAQLLHEAQWSALCSAMSRAYVGRALSKALDVELPRLASKWYLQLKRDHNAGGGAAQSSVTAAVPVKEFWDFIEVQLYEIQRFIESQIASIDAAAPTQRDPNVESILGYLRGDDEAMRRTTELVPSTLRQEVLQRMRLVASDLDEFMKKAFDRHISATNGTCEAFGPARTMGLLLAACVTVCRLRGFDDGQGISANPAVVALLERWAGDAMQLEFAIGEKPNFINEPVYPTLPESDGAAACGGGTFDVARRFFSETRVIVGSDCLQRAIGLYFEHCDYTYTQLSSGALVKALFLTKLAMALAVVVLMP